MNSIIRNLVGFSIISKSSKIIFRNSSKLSEHATVLNDQTLTGRFLLYFNSDKSENINTKKILTNLPQADRHILNEIYVENLVQYSHFLRTNEQVINSEIFTKLDEACFKRLKDFSIEETLKILNIFMKLISNHIIKSRYYNQAIQNLYDQRNNLNKNDLLQLMFYVGLQKKTEYAQRVIRDCLRLIDEDFISNLKTEELCIICNSAFKTSTKINNKILLDYVNNHLNNNLSILDDSALFITLIKTVRHNRYQDENLLESISCTIFFNKLLNKYSFAALCHILALYSDYLYYDGSLLEHFAEKCINELKGTNYISKNIHLIDQLRLKDIKRFIWALSHLNYQKLESTDIKDVIIPKILERHEEIQQDPESIMEIMLYLWMLNYRAYELVPYIFTRKNIDIIKDNKSKGRERLNLLLHCIYFEDRPLFWETKQKTVGNPNYPIMKQFKKRPLLEKVFNNLKTNQNGINRFELTCEIPFLNIVGITGYKKKIYKAIYIEVLDEYTCVKNGEGPSGLMALKLRILDKFEEALVVISQEETVCATDSSLQEFLDSEINFVC